MNKERQIILKLVAEGKITVEEADELLNAVDSSSRGPFIGDFFKSRRAGSEERAKERAEQRARQRWDERRQTGRGGPFEFNFPWDQPDWQWPWDRQDWRWPWEEPDWHWPWERPGTTKSDSVLEVPEGSQLNVKNDGGDLVIIGTDEPSLRITGHNQNRKVYKDNNIINILSAGADFTIEVPPRVASMEVTQSGGDLRIERPGADMALRIIGGDLSISGATGQIKVLSDGGDVDLMDITSAEMEVQAGGGDISLNMLPIIPDIEKGSVTLSAESGDISLLLPPGFKCQIYASTSDGEINHTLLPMESVEIIEETEKRLNAKLNGGGAEFVLVTKTGDINIKA